jgi:nucleoside-diphosphate-sugar epimerase
VAKEIQAIMITVLGARGFIGSGMVASIKKQGMGYFAPLRGEDFGNQNLGHVVYCVGLTADFRKKPFETVDAHVCYLCSILEKGNFDSLTYLSSTRVYINSLRSVAEETDHISVDPLNPDELYTLTKLTGERLCLSSGRNVKIARLSNIIGNDFNSNNFLTEITRKIYEQGSFTLYTTLQSAKDYLYIEDATDLLIKIATRGKEKIYNVASGKNTSNEEIITELEKHSNFTFRVSEDAKQIISPKISVNKIATEFNFTPTDIKTKIYRLLK